MYSPLDLRTLPHGHLRREAAPHYCGAALEAVEPTNPHHLDRPNVGTQDQHHSPVAVLTCACRVNAPRNAMQHMIFTAALIIGLAVPAAAKREGGICL